MVAFAKANVLDLGTDLQHRRGTLHLEALNDRDAVAISQKRAVGILDDELIVVLSGGFRFVQLVTAFRANNHTVVFVRIFGLALRAGRQGGHVDGFLSEGKNNKEKPSKRLKETGRL